MLGNYLSAAIRNLLRDRAFTLINLFGLSLGFAAAILIGLYVRDEYSYDKFIPNHERIYRVDEIVNAPGRAPMRISVSASTDGASLKLAFPEVEEAARLASASPRIYRDGDNEGVSPSVAWWADPSFFRMFPLVAIHGTLANALDRPDSLVMTRTFARTVFGRDDVVGKTVLVGSTRVPLRITAVIEDWPSNSHLGGEVFLPAITPFSALSQADAEMQRPGALRRENAVTYIRLRPGADIEKVRAGLPAFVQTHIPGEVGGFRIASAYTFLLSPLSDIHLMPRSLGDTKPPSDPRVVNAMIGIAVLILVVACGNFVSMMTARAARRAVEVGVRKTVGATRRQIMAQFMGESLFYSVLAAIPALIAVDLVLPAFNAFLQRNISLDYGADPALALGLATLVVGAGLAAGAYPALYLSRFQPNAVLKGTSLLPHSSSVRQALVVFQFATLIGLLIATFTVNRQAHYAIADRLNLPADQIYMSARPGVCEPSFESAVRGIDGVRGATCASDSALSFGHFSAIFSAAPGAQAVAARAAPVDYSYFEVFGVKPLAGRLLSADRGQDDLLAKGPSLTANPAMIINESAARALGFASPAEAVGKFRMWQRIDFKDGQLQPLEPMSSEIVGVVADFSIGSVREAIEPTAYYIDPPPFLNYHVLKLDGGAIQKTLASVADLYKQRQPALRFDGRFLSQYMNELYADIKTQSTIFTAFAGVAIALAALGLLGLAIFTAERRTKEIGLRKVMGARRADILVFLGWQFTRPVLWANLVAWPCAWLLLQRWLQGFAYHVELQFVMFVFAGALALVIALATVTGHALLVARAKPVEALRYE